jgi:hypothetical protein
VISNKIGYVDRMKGCVRFTKFRFSKPVLSCARRLNGARIISQSVFAAVIGAAVIFDVAHAQSAEPSYCKSYALTGAEFVSNIKVIVSHGDLTDVPFVEKTIGSKFEKLVPHGMEGEASQFLLGWTWQAMGAPIRIGLAVNFSSARQLKFRNIAQMSIESETLPHLDVDFIGDCLHIPISSFYSAFGAFENMPDGSTAKEIPGKNHSKIVLTVGYNAKNNRVEEVDIDQSL